MWDVSGRVSAANKCYTKMTWTACEMSQTFSCKLVREIIEGNLNFKVSRDMSTKTRNLVFLLRKKVSICQGDHKVGKSQRRFSSNFQFVNLPPLAFFAELCPFRPIWAENNNTVAAKKPLFFTLSAPSLATAWGKPPSRWRCLPC